MISDIEINLAKILKDNINLPNSIKIIIESLYSKSINGNIEIFNSCDMINIESEKSRNNLNILDDYKNNTGVYIFLNNDLPVYIGVAGNNVKSNHSIKDRVGVHLKCDDNATLPNNIYTIETLLGNDVINLTKINRKNLILTYAPKLIIINIGLLHNEQDIKKSNDLEQLLISLFNSKYNK